jgi:pimeloyl-ACP methyl ester carboxylesterase
MFAARLWAPIGFALLTVAAPALAGQTDPSSRPTIVLVHGAFAESNSWNGVIRRLEHDGYRVIAAAVPLRTLKGDASYVASLVKSVPGNVILVGHSYGGEVISEAATVARNVKALVFVAGFAPDVGESAASISARFPGSTLEETLAPPVANADGSKDLYIAQDKFWHQFAGDLPRGDAELMSVGQRPITAAALAEPATSAAWRMLPSWFVYGSLDRNIPQAAQAFMARRADARKTVVIKGASHVVMVSHPLAVATLIEEAAQEK